MADDPQLLARLHEAIVGSPDLDGNYSDAVMARLLEALDAAWALTDARGVSGQVVQVNGLSPGPWNLPTSLLDDCNQQVRSRFRANDAAKWRNMPEAAQQLSNLLAVLTQTSPVPEPPPPSDDGRVLWAADMSQDDTTAAGCDDWPQWQDNGGSIYRGSPLPIVPHPQLGRAVRLTLPKGGERREAMPPTSVRYLSEGSDRYVRVDFVLAPGYPVGQSNAWCLCSQLHDAGTGSPPIEFDIHDNALWVRGNSTAYNKRLAPLDVGEPYQLVYHVVTSSSAERSLLEVWVNGGAVLAGFRPPIPFLNGGDSYLKGFTHYADPSIAPSGGMTIYEANYRVGSSYGVVTR